MVGSGSASRTGTVSPEAGDVIAPDRHPRMPHFRTILATGDIIDADFEEVVETGSRETFANTSQEEMTRKSAIRGIPVFVRAPAQTHLAADRVRRGLFPAAVVALCAASFWIFGGHAVLARLVSGGAGKAPLMISGVSTRVSVVDGLRVAVVNGHVRNTTAGTLKVPAIGVRAGQSGRPVTVTATAQTLRSGQSTGFRARLPVAEGPVPRVDVVFLPGSSTD